MVGETARPGVWASCGFSDHGVMHAPAVAESLAAMILGQTPPCGYLGAQPTTDGAAGGYPPTVRDKQGTDIVCFSKGRSG